MGKGNRSRKQRTTSVGSPVAEGPYFHGGVPGKSPGDMVWSAQRLGFAFQYRASEAPYDPSYVYISTDVNVATTYASRYVDFYSNREGYGDVYEVEPLETPQADPDYHVFPEVFVRCRSARITRVVDTGVWLSRTEQNYLGRHYDVWGERGYPVFDDTGHIIPSEQMRANGVTREWTKLLRPWLGTQDVDPYGRLSISSRSSNLWSTVLYAVPALDRDCQIHRNPLDRRSLQCVVCKFQTEDQYAAALHQLGEHPMHLLTRIYGWKSPPVPPLVDAARTYNPERWSWWD